MNNSFTMLNWTERQTAGDKQTDKKTLKVGCVDVDISLDERRQEGDFPSKAKLVKGGRSTAEEK